MFKLAGEEMYKDLIVHYTLKRLDVSLTQRKTPYQIILKGSLAKYFMVQQTKFEIRNKQIATEFSRIVAPSREFKSLDFDFSIAYSSY